MCGWGIIGGKRKGTPASGWKPVNLSHRKPKQPQTQVIFPSALSNFAVRERALQPRGSTGFSQPGIAPTVQVIKRKSHHRRREIAMKTRATLFSMLLLSAIWVVAQSTSPSGSTPDQTMQSGQTGTNPQPSTPSTTQPAQTLENPGTPDANSPNGTTPDQANPNQATPSHGAAPENQTTPNASAPAAGGAGLTGLPVGISHHRELHFDGSLREHLQADWKLGERPHDGWQRGRSHWKRGRYCSRYEFQRCERKFQCRWTG